MHAPLCHSPVQFVFQAVQATSPLACPAPHECYYHRRIVLCRTDWECSNWQHYTIYSENGNCRLQLSNYWSYGIKVKQTKALYHGDHGDVNVHYLQEITSVPMRWQEEKGRKLQLSFPVRLREAAKYLERCGLPCLLFGFQELVLRI